MSENNEYIQQAIEEYASHEARTGRFRFGAPRAPHMLGDGSRFLFLRSQDGQDNVTSLWMAIPEQQREIKIADPRELLDNAGDESVPAEERARRERAREANSGIVDFSVDDEGTRAVFTMNGALFVSDIHEGTTRTITPHFSCDVEALAAPILNPRISPDGSLIAYSADAGLVIVDIATGNAVSMLVVPQDMRDVVHTGIAEFVAGEEMDRYDGFWWSPDSRSLLVEQFDASDEPLWYIVNPTDPTQPADARRYAQALTKNAVVSLHAVAIARDEHSQLHVHTKRVSWDNAQFEYLAAVSWSAGYNPVLLVQDRLQQHDAVLEVLLDDGDGDTVATDVLATHHNEQWLDLILGTPARTPDGALLCAINDMEHDTNRLTLNGHAFTPVGWQVRHVLGVDESGVLCVVQRTPQLAADVPDMWRDDAHMHDARSYDVVFIDYEGNLTPINSAAGVYSGAMGKKGIVLTGSSMHEARATMTWKSRVHEDHVPEMTIASYAREPRFTPCVEFTQLGDDALFTAIVTPSKASKYAHAQQLPVLMKPYAGPGFQQVVLQQSSYFDAQWWADQGFIVVITDGHGTTGRGPRFDRAIYKNMKRVTLDDQVAAVHALPDAIAALNAQSPTPIAQPDLQHVAMIGWSYGGFISAAAVLEEPDVFAAACAGAPPVDWTLYDTHYTERYLGLDPQVYEDNSILDDAPQLVRPLMLIHGFADDNVTIANSLRLSQRLMQAGRDHTYLPLTGITHMTNEPAVAKNLLLLQRDFLIRAFRARH